MVGTVVFVVAAVLSVVGPEPARIAAAGVSVTLFVLGCTAFIAGFVAGIGRSRTEQVDMAGLFLLIGTAPRSTRRFLLGLLAVQVVVACTAAALRPFTESAFGVLAPMFGLGLMALWGGHNGSFLPKPVDDRTGD